MGPPGQLCREAVLLFWDVLRPHLSSSPSQRPGARLTRCLTLQEPLWVLSERNHSEWGEEGGCVLIVRKLKHLEYSGGLQTALPLSPQCQSEGLLSITAEQGWFEAEECRRFQKDFLACSGRRTEEVGRETADRNGGQM